MAAAVPDDARFRLAVSYIRSLPSDGPVTLANQDKLYLYGLFKQGQEGDCSIPKPSMFDPFGRAKWQAWHRMAGKEPAACLVEYADLVVDIVGRMDASALSPDQEAMRQKFLGEMRSAASIAEEAEEEDDEAKAAAGKGARQQLQKEEEKDAAAAAPSHPVLGREAEEKHGETPRTPRREEVGGGDAHAQLAALEARLSAMMQRVAEASAGAAGGLEQVGAFRDELRRLVETMDERARRMEAEYEQAEREWREEMRGVQLMQQQLLSRLRQHGIDAGDAATAAAAAADGDDDDTPAPGSTQAARQGHPWLWLLFRAVKAGVPLGVAAYVAYQYASKRRRL